VLLRGGVYIGDNSVVGNGSEVKNTAVMAGSNLSHMVGVFDAIIGRGVNVGGGAMFANSQLYGKAVKATLSDRRIDTDLQHFSTILADSVQLGANVVLGPGAILDRGSSVYPCTRFHGYAAEGEAVKTHSY
jgi:bifunctional UDP-N-acetylglucosamine pyrophosphorylase/glucosamine-1-phosphate N-acetyltransferase